MLDQALKVVEAARALQLTYVNGKTTSDLDMRTMALALDGLRKSIENFDAITSYSAGEMAIKHRPEFSVPLQMADDGYVEDLREINPTAEMKLEAKAEKTLEAEEVSELEEKQELKKTIEEESKVLAALPKPVLAAAVLSRMTARPARKGPGGNTVDLGDGVFYDGDESASDLLLAMDAINDKLTYAVRKIGWSPRLRQMAMALRRAQENLTIEMKGEHGYVTVPAHQWGTLSVAIAEAALNQDLTIALPQPKPRHEKELELEQQRKNAPRPPSHMFNR